jgi:hypothetical protein
MNRRSYQCRRCGWSGNLSVQGSTSGPIASLVISIFVLTITGSCAIQSYTGPYGDEKGFGPMALAESGILILTIVWLGIGLSLRSTAPRNRKLAIIRASAGLTLAAVAICLTLGELAAPDSSAHGLSVALLGISAIGLLYTSARTLNRRR